MEALKTNWIGFDDSVAQLVHQESCELNRSRSICHMYKTHKQPAVTSITQYCKSTLIKRIIICKPVIYEPSCVQLQWREVLKVAETKVAALVSCLVSGVSLTEPCGREFIVNLSLTQHRGTIRGLAPPQKLDSTSGGSTPVSEDTSQRMSLPVRPQNNPALELIQKTQQ